jgi:hypothetical protein
MRLSTCFEGGGLVDRRANPGAGGGQAAGRAGAEVRNGPGGTQAAALSGAPAPHRLAERVTSVDPHSRVPRRRRSRGHRRKGHRWDGLTASPKLDSPLRTVKNCAGLDCAGAVLLTRRLRSRRSLLMVSGFPLQALELAAEVPGIVRTRHGVNPPPLRPEGPARGPHAAPPVTGPGPGSASGSCSNQWKRHETGRALRPP